MLSKSLSFNHGRQKDFFQGGAIVGFSGGGAGGQQDFFEGGAWQWWNFILSAPKLREKHFSTNLLARFQFSNSKGLWASFPLSDAHASMFRETGFSRWQPWPIPQEYEWWSKCTQVLSKLGLTLRFSCSGSQSKYFEHKWTTNLSSWKSFSLLQWTRQSLVLLRQREYC